jgi:transcriptional regulator with XRE-family HTH domain
MKGDFRPISSAGRPNIIGRRLRRVRRERGLSQEDLAAALSVDFGIEMDRSAVGKIEQGRRAVADYEVAALAAVLDVSVGEFFEGEGAEALEELLRSLQRRG